MIIHISPRIYDKLFHSATQLVDIVIPELNITLKNDIDVVVRKPYPNKAYLVACRKSGQKNQKAIDGIFIKTDSNIDKFSVLTRWTTNHHQIIEHHVHFTILDHEFDFYTDDPVHWYATGCDKFESRWPGEFIEPVYLHPRMENIHLADKKSTLSTVIDTTDGRYLIRRIETMDIPSIHPDRLFSEYAGDRIPSLKDAFLGIPS